MRRPGKIGGKAVKRRKTLRRRNARAEVPDRPPATEIDGRLRAAFEEALADHAWKTTLAKNDLQSAYDYWILWRYNYKWNSWLWAIAFFLLLAVFLVFIGRLAWHELLSDRAAPLDTGVALQRIAIFGTVVALFVWALHQLLRMWAYFEDMRNDAIERIGLLTAFAALKGANWLTAADVTLAVTALFRPRRSNIEAPAAPATSFDAIGKHAGEAVKKAKGR